MNMQHNPTTKFQTNDHYRIKGIYLTKCTLNFEETSPPLPKGTQPPPLDIGLQINTSSYHLKENQIIIQLEIIIKGSQNENIFFNSEIVYQGLFEFDPQNPLPKLDTFINQNGPAILYSFARPFVFDLMSQAGIYPFYLPIVLITNQPSPKQQQ